MADDFAMGYMLGNDSSNNGGFLNGEGIWAVSAAAYADGVLTLTLPDNITYIDGRKYCIVIGQAIPATTTLTADVVAVIGAGTTEFPLLTRCGTAVTAQQISTRKRYPVRIDTTATGGTIKILCDLPCVDADTLNALNDA